MQSEAIFLTHCSVSETHNPSTHSQTHCNSFFYIYTAVLLCKLALVVCIFPFSCPQIHIIFSSKEFTTIPYVISIAEEREQISRRSCDALSAEENVNKELHSNNLGRETYKQGFKQERSNIYPFEALRSCMQIGEGEGVCWCVAGCVSNRQEAKQR